MHLAARRFLVVIVTLGLFMAGPDVTVQAQTGERCFAETGVCISGPIRAFWERNGGLAVFGLPIAPQQEELIEGRPIRAQWFERNRLELHPENPPPYTVLLGRLGVDRLAQQGRDWFTFPRSGAQGGCRFFPETGHNICGEMLAAWRRGRSESASLELFGLPLSDAQTENIAGRDYQVQWFERARFELHPQNPAPYNVLLGLLGAEVRTTALTPPDPCADVPDPVGARILPGKCITHGQPITIVLDGFQPDEAIGFWLTAPDGTIIPAEQLPGITPNAAPEGFGFDTAGLFPGRWFWVFQGASSGRSAVVHFMVLPSGAPAPPPPNINYVVNWESPQNITNSGDKSFFPATAVDSNNRTHIVYATDDGNLWYTNDLAGGFGGAQHLANNVGSGGDRFVSLAVGPGNLLHLAYSVGGGDQQVYYQQGRLDGPNAYWSPPQLISDGGAKSVGGDMAVDRDNNAHIVWIDRRCGNYNVFYRVRRADGSVSGTSAPLGDCVFQNRPQVTVTGNGAVHILFQHDRDMFYARQDGGGWAIQDLSQSPRSNSLNPAIATDGNVLFAAWDEGVNDHDVQYRVSSDGGQSWSGLAALSDTPAFASFPSATYSTTSRRIYIVWADATGADDGQTEIWFREFDPATGAVSEPRRLTYLPNSSTLPTIASGPGRVVVSWQDKTTGQWQIFVVSGTLTPG